MTLKNQIAIYLFSILILSSCSTDDTIDRSVNVSQEAELFLNEVLEVMEVNSINRHQIDWADFRTKVFSKVDGAQTFQDTYPGIREALVLLNDNHSVFFKADGGSIFVGSIQCSVQEIAKPTLPSNIGYVKVNSFSGSSNDSEAISFAQEIQNQIIGDDHADLKGWIVDLRGNGGGNMYPMIAGIGPILGEGIAGYFIDADNNQTSWGFVDGASVIQGNSVTKLDDSYELIITNPKVAVLLDNGIASSGEVVAISFIGRDGTRSFGAPTCGLSTGNTRFNFSHNCNMLLTTVVLADRNKNQYGREVIPDETTSNEDIISKAIEWLEN